MRTFLDTNVFLYAFLDQDAAKKPVAARLVSNAVRAGNGFISLQVVNEFCNVMVKKSGKALSEILEATKLFGRFPMVDGSLRLTQRTERADSDFDVFVIGDEGLRSISARVGKVAEASGVEVNPYVVTELEFKKRLAKGDHFLTEVMATPKIFLKGGENELAGMA